MGDLISSASSPKRHTLLGGLLGGTAERQVKHLAPRHAARNGWDSNCTAPLSRCRLLFSHPRSHTHTNVHSHMHTHTLIYTFKPTRPSCTHMHTHSETAHSPTHSTHSHSHMCGVLRPQDRTQQPSGHLFGGPFPWIGRLPRIKFTREVGVIKGVAGGPHSTPVSTC